MILYHPVALICLHTYEVIADGGFGAITIFCVIRHPKIIYATRFGDIGTYVQEAAVFRGAWPSVGEFDSIIARIQSRASGKVLQSNGI